MVPQKVRLDEQVPVLARSPEVCDEKVVDGTLSRVECRDEPIDLFGGRINDDWDGMPPGSVRSCERYAVGGRSVSDIDENGYRGIQSQFPTLL